MAIGVNYNAAGSQAVLNLFNTGNELTKTQNAIATGKKIASPKDSGAFWAIANKQSSDVLAYDVVSQSVDRANSILDTAISAATAISDVLNQAKAKALTASQAGLSTATYNALDADFQQLKSQITNIVANASFDNVNLIKATPDSAVALGDAAGGNTITVAGIDLNLGTATITVAAGSSLTSAANATTALGQINASIDNLNTQLATFGSGSLRFATQKKFVGQIQDALSAGVSSLTDADLTKESAKLQALQVKQQLGIQALSIANQSFQAALGLFR